MTVRSVRNTQDPAFSAPAALQAARQYLCLVDAPHKFSEVTADFRATLAAACV
jgi:hypothetical protein